MNLNSLLKLKKTALALTLATSIAATAVSPAYAAPKSNKTTVSIVNKKPNISKSSTLYKELTGNGMFDAEYYAKCNPDVVAVLGNNYNALLNHFLNYGIYEGRQPNVDFNVDAYSSAYADLQSAFDKIENDYQVVLSYYTHYVNHGKYEGREITTIAEANAAGITVTKVGTDTPVANRNVAPAAVSTPAPAQPSTPMEVSNPEQSPSQTPSPVLETPTEPETPSEPEVPSPHIHDYDAGVVTTPATKTEEGVMTYTCRSCNETKTEPIEKLTTHDCESEGHEFECIETVAATCAEDGCKQLKCKYCEETDTETITKTNTHTYPENYEVKEESTCTQNGVGVYKCTVCGNEENTISLPLKDHNYEWVVTKEATETEDGRKDHKCSECGAVDTYEVIPAEEEETCQHTGNIITYYADRPTCGTPQLYYDKCATCDTVVKSPYSKDNKLNPTNHEGFTKTVIKDPTEAETGIARYTCTGCDFNYETEIPMVGSASCSHNDTINVSEADECWEVCILCGEKVRKVGFACIHITKREEVIKEANETENGLVKIYCEECEACIENVTVHAYKAYEVDLGNGEVGTVYGYLEDEYNNTVINGENSYLDENGWSYKVFVLENEYRVVNGLDALEWNYYLQEGANLRAVEAGYKFSHTRPNEEPWYTVSTYMSGENLGSGHKSPEAIMQGWKDSEGHNRNLLSSSFKSVAVGVFHMYTFTAGSAIPNERIIWAQNFSYIG